MKPYVHGSPLHILKELQIRDFLRVREVRWTRRTCPANFQNIRRRAAAKFNQMSCEKLQMSGEAKKDFVYNADSRLGNQKVP